MRYCDALLIAFIAVGLAACATSPPEDTISELSNVNADLEKVPIADRADRADRAEQSYRRYLEETPEAGGAWWAGDVGGGTGEVASCEGDGVVFGVDDSQPATR